MVNEIQFLKGNRASFDSLSKNSNYFYIVTEEDNSYSLYLGEKLLSKGKDSSGLSTHIGDKNIHITSDERIKWNKVIEDFANYEKDRKLTDKNLIDRLTVTSTNKTITLSENAEDNDIDVNIDGITIVKDTNGVLSVSESALTSYNGKDSINVSDANDGIKTISLTIDSDDKVLTQTAQGLVSNINLTWDKKDGLKLLGKDGTEIAKIAATDFIKDGMLTNVELKNGSGLNSETMCLIFTFNTDAGQEAIEVPVTDLIDVYTAGNGINVSGNSISVKLDGTTSGRDSYLAVDSNGLRTVGIKTAIDAAKTTVSSDTDNANTTAHLTITKTTASGESGDGHDNYKIQLKDVASASDLANEITYRKNVTGVQGDAYSATTEGTNYISGATTMNDADVKLDKAIQGVRTDLGESGATASDTSAFGRIKTLESSVVKRVIVNGVTGETSDNDASVTIDGRHVKTSSEYSAATYSTDPSIIGKFTAVTSGKTLDEAIKQVDTNVATLVDEVLSNKKTTTDAIDKIESTVGLTEDGSLPEITNDKIYSGATSILNAIEKIDEKIKSQDTKLDTEITNREALKGNGNIVVEKSIENTQQTIYLQWESF